MHLDQPLLLLLLPLCLFPLAGRQAEWRPAASLLDIPQDRLGNALETTLRLLLASAMAAILLGLAGLHRGEGEITRTGHGAHILLLLDRSLSMDEGLALRGEKARMSKTAAAANLIEDFFTRRPADRFGLIAFSTEPIPILPLTEHREAVAAAMHAMRDPGLANTDIGAGFKAALAAFAGDDPAASRVILFVSDGAGRISPATQTDIRLKMMLQRVHLYYLYLRSGDSPPLAGTAGNDLSQPAALDAFFRDLGIPYQGFEASDPNAVITAVQAIGRLENKPIAYHELEPRRGLEPLCYCVALACLAILLLARHAERGFAIHGPRP